MFILDIMDKLNEFGDKIQVFFKEHFDNPLMWLVFFGLGLLIFKYVYDKLSKEK